MIHVDRTADVQLVTDRPGTYQTTFKSAIDLEPGDAIAVGFGNYGDLVMRVVDTNYDVDRAMVDVRLVASTERAPGVDLGPTSFGHTTVFRRFNQVRVYPAGMIGKWL